MQKGATLLVSLVLLVLIMLMGTTAMVTSDTQLKLSGNLQFEDAALNNAEIAIGKAESLLFAAGSDYVSSPGFGTYSSASPELYPMHMSVSPLTMQWDNSNSAMVNDDTQRYLVQLISKNVSLQPSDPTTDGTPSMPEKTVHTFLVTARGTSARGAVKFIQSYVALNATASAATGGKTQTTAKGTGRISWRELDSNN
jgi:Tfp pilus assembly protein PilX